MAWRVVLSVVLCGSFTLSAQAGSVGPGSVSGTWLAADSPIVVQGDIEVPIGETLVIEPGVSVDFAGVYTLTVSGDLNAQGASGLPVVFSSGGTFRQILFDGGGGLLTWTNFSDGGDGAAATVRAINGAAPVFEDCIISGSLSAGVSFETGTTAVLRRALVTGSTEHGIVLNGAAALVEETMVELNGTTVHTDFPVLVGTVADVRALGSLNSYDSNQSAYIPIPGGTVPNGHVWYGQSIPYIAAGSLNLAAGGAVTTWMGGLILKMPLGSEIVTTDDFTVDGDSITPVIITSIRDDAVGGDSSPGDAALPAPGDWLGMRATIGGAGATLTLDWVTLRYGGGATVSATAANLRLDDTSSTVSTANLSHVTIEGSNNHGIYAANRFTVNVTDSIIENNGQLGNGNGIHAATATARLSVSGSTLRDNGSWSLYGVSLTDLPLMGVTANLFENTAAGPHGAGSGAFLAYFVNRVTGNRAGTWPADGTIVISGQFETNNNAASNIITVAPGAVIKFNTNSRIYLRDGGFNVAGTSGQRVTFTSLLDDSVGGDTNGNGDNGRADASPGDWQALYLNDDDNKTFNGDINYADFRFGGGNGESGMVATFDSYTHINFNNGSFEDSATAGFYYYHNDCCTAGPVGTAITFDAVTFDGNQRAMHTFTRYAKRFVVSNSFIRNHAAHGIYGTTYPAIISIQNTQFENNGSWAAEGLHIQSLVGTFDNSYVGSAALQAFVVTGGSTTASGTWDPGMPIVVRNSSTIGNNSSTTINIAQDAVFKFESTGHLNFRDGSLTVSGAEGQEVYFTSIQDDSIGGDTNGNGDHGQDDANPGDWRGIYMDDDDNHGFTGRINYAIFRFGGGGSEAGMVSSRDSYADIAFTNSHFEHSASAGFYYHHNDCCTAGPVTTPITFDASTFDGNHRAVQTYARYGKRFAITNGFVRNQVSQGVYGTTYPTYFTIQGTEFSNNGSWSAHGLHVQSAVSISGNTFPGSPEFQGFGITGGASTASGTWAANAPLIFYNSSTVGNNSTGTTIDIAASTFIKFGAGGHLNFADGNLNVNGTLGQEVYFTSLADDSVYGDTNGNGDNDQADANPGDWRGVYLDDDDNRGFVANINYAIFRYGGGDESGMVSTFDSYANIGFVGSRFENSASAGYYYYHNDCCTAGPVTTPISFETTTFDGNQRAMRVYARYGKRFSVTNSFLRNQTLHGIYATTYPAYFTIQGTEFNGNGSWAAHGLHIQTLVNTNSNTFLGGPEYNALVVTGGSSTSSGTWPSNTVVVFENSPAVGNNSTTTINIGPGSIFKFGPGGHFNVRDGTFNIAGEQDNEVYFTALTDDSVGGDTNGDGDFGDTQVSPGYWRGVYLNDDDNKAFIADINYTVFRFGGGGGEGGMVSTFDSYSTITFDGCRFENSLTAGYYYYHNDCCTAGPTTPAITFNNSRFDGNLRGIQTYTRHSKRFVVSNSFLRNSGQQGILATTYPARFSLVNNQFSGNGSWAAQGLHVDTLASSAGNTFPGTPEYQAIVIQGSNGTASGTWNPGGPVVFRGVSGVGNNAATAITVTPGNVFKFDTDARLEFRDGSLTVNGTKDNEVYFTSLKDDSVGGDTNADGDHGQAHAAAGDWGSVYLDDDDNRGFTGIIDHAVFRYGGGGGQQGMVQSFDGYALLDINNSRFENSLTDGFRFYDNDCCTAGPVTTPNTITECTFDGNRTGAFLDSRHNKRFTLTGNSFRNQRAHGVRVNRGTGIIRINGSLFQDNGGWAIDSAYYAQLPTMRGNTYLNTTGDVGGLGISVRGGTWSGAQSWPNEGAAHIVVADTTTASGAVITFDPGSVLKFSPGVYFQVGGGLNAVGTALQPIVFTSVKDDEAHGDTDGNGTSTAFEGDWEYVRLGSASSNTLRHVQFKYGGAASGASLEWRTAGGSIEDCLISRSSTAGIRTVAGGDVSVRRCRIENNRGFGIQIADASSYADAQDSVFAGNGDYAIHNVTPDRVPLIADNDFTQNTRPGVSIRGTALSTIVNWPDLSTPYVLLGQVLVQGHLVLEPGAVVKVPSGTNLAVHGRLFARAGTVPTVITSLTDDIYGDSNLDGATGANAGDWGSILVDTGGGDARLDNVRISYGGAGPMGALQVQGAAAVDLRNSVIRNNRYGIACASGGIGLVANSLITANEQGVHADGCPDLVIAGAQANLNEIRQNTAYGVSNTATAGVDLDARGNYWGDKAGPFHATDNPTTTGNAVTDFVDWGQQTAVIADAGADFDVEEGQGAALDGSASRDLDGSQVTYAWSQDSGPSATLSDAAGAEPTFTAPAVAEDTPMAFSLVVTADGVASSPDTVVVTITPTNDAPVALPGADRTVFSGEAVVTDGSGSDANGDAITTYAWTQTGGDPVALNDADSPNAFFTAPQAASAAIVLQLVVTDSKGLDSAPATVAFTVSSAPATFAVTAANEDPGGYDYLAGEPEVVIGEILRLVGTGLDETNVTSVLINGVPAFFDTLGNETDLEVRIPAGSARGNMRLRISGIDVQSVVLPKIVEVLATTNEGTSVRLFNADDLATPLVAVTVLDSSIAVITPLRISPSGRYLAVPRTRCCSNPEVVQVIDLVTAAVVGPSGGMATRDAPADGWLTAVEFIDEEHIIVADGFDGSISILDLSDPDPANWGRQALLAMLEPAGEHCGYASDVAIIPGPVQAPATQPGPVMRPVQWVAVANDGLPMAAPLGPVSTVSLIDVSDPAAAKIAESIDLGALSGPEGGGHGASSVAASPDGRWILVTNPSSDTVSIIEHRPPASFAVVGPALPVGDNPQAIDIAEGGERAFVLNDGATDDSITIIDLKTSPPSVLGTISGEPLVVDTTWGNTQGCIDGYQEYNNVLVDASFAGDRLFVATGKSGAASFYEIEVPAGYPVTSAITHTWASGLSGAPDGIAVQSGKISDTDAPKLTAISLHDADGLLAMGPGDFVRFIYDEPVSTGLRAANLDKGPAEFATLAAALVDASGADLGTLSADQCVLSVADDVISITLGGSIGGLLEPGGTMTPVLGSVDDGVGNPLDDLTPAPVIGSFFYDFEPTFIVSQVQDNGHIRAVFDMDVSGHDAAGCWTVTKVIGDLAVSVSTSEAISAREALVTLDAPGLLVGSEYRVEACSGIRDTVNDLLPNNERSQNRLTAVDLTPPIFTGLESAVDGALARDADGEVDLSWTAATGEAGAVTYSVFYSFTTQPDPTVFGPRATVKDATSFTVENLIVGLPYHFVVRASDEDDNGETNDVLHVATATDSRPPAWIASQVGIVSARDTNLSGTIAITFGQATDTSSAPVSYNIYYSIDPGTVFDSSPAAVLSDWVDVYEVTGLSDGTQYFFAVRAVDAATPTANEDENGQIQEATPGYDDQAPSFAGIVSVVDDGTDGVVHLSWGAADEASRGGNLPVTYNVYWTADPAADPDAGGNSDLVFASAPQRSQGSVGLSLSGLQNGMRYIFGVRAEDSWGNEDGNRVARGVAPTIDTTPPAFGGITSAAPLGTNALVRLTWAPVQDNLTPKGVAASPQVTYDLYYVALADYLAGTAGLFDEIRVLDLPQDASEFTISGLGDQTEYLFAVRAKDARGNQLVDQTECTIGDCGSTGVCVGDDGVQQCARTAIPTQDSIAPVFGGLTAASPGVSSGPNDASGTVELNWDPAQENLNLDGNPASPPVSYEIYLTSTADGSDVFGGEPIAVVDGAMRTCPSGNQARHCVADLPLLPSGQSYWFAVRASDATGNSIGEQAQCTTGNCATEGACLSEASSSVPECLRAAAPLDDFGPLLTTVDIMPSVPAQAVIGDFVEVAFTVSEPLALEPTVTLQTADSPVGTEDAILMSQSGLTYTFVYAVTGQEDEGDRPVLINLADDFQSASFVSGADFSDRLSFDFRTDFDAPTVSFISPRDGDELNVARPVFEIDFFDGGSGVACSSLRFSIDNAPVALGCANYDGGSGRFTYSPPSPMLAGVHLIAISVADQDGNDTGSVSISFTILGSDQLAIAPQSAALTQNQTQRFTASWTRGTDNCTWTAGGGTLVPATGLSPFVDYIATGAPGSTHSITAHCVDADASQQAMADVDIINPLAIEPAVATVLVGGQQLLRAVSSFSNPDFQWTLPDGSTATGSTLLFDAGLTVGQYTVRLEDRNNGLVTSATVGVIPGDFDIGRAILVAGGSMNDHLWQDSKNLTEFAYTVLQSRGFSDEQIYFMTQGGSFDFDSDGTAEVDAVANLGDVDGLGYAIKTWAGQSPGSPLFIYLVDHGGPGSMWLADGNANGIADLDEILSVEALAQMLDFLDPGTPVVVLYEACKSGSFLGDLGGPQRILLTTSGFENATIALDGTISFSQYFYAAVAEGRTVGESFDLASAAMAVISDQVPQLDDDGDGVGNGFLDGDAAELTFLGFPFAGGDDITSIASVSAVPDVEPIETSLPPAQVGQATRLAARVVTPLLEDGTSVAIKEVYALVVPPDYAPPAVSGDFETPELDLGRVQLLGGEGGQYAATVGPHHIPGTYRFLVYATDSEGRRALPRQASIEYINPPPTLLAISPAPGSDAVRIDTSISFQLQDALHAVDSNATRLVLTVIDESPLLLVPPAAPIVESVVDVTASLVITGSDYLQEITYPVTTSNELPQGRRIQLTIETADRADPPASATYEVFFRTAGGLFTENHSPAPWSVAVSSDSRVELDLRDASGFGINPGSIVMEIDGSAVPVVISEGDVANEPGSLEWFALSYTPPTAFAAGATVTVAIRAQDTAGHAMTPDEYELYIATGNEVTDTDAPVVSAWTPADGATEVQPSTDIQWVLADATGILTSSIELTVLPQGRTSQSYRVDDAQMSCVADAVEGPRLITCNLSLSNSFVSQQVAMTLTATDGPGNVLNAAASFEVALSSPGPYLRLIAPAPDTIAVNVSSSPISMQITDTDFGVDPGTLSVTVAGQVVTGAGCIQCAQVTATDPAESPPKTYTVTFDNGGQPWPYSDTIEIAVSAEDLGGNAMAPQVWSFDTDLGMRLRSSAPGSGYVDVPRETGIELTLDHLGAPDVDFDTAQVELLVNSERVAASISTSPGTLTLSAQPSAPFNYGERVTVVVNTTDTHVHTATNEVRYWAVDDVGSPYVDALQPAAFATGVSVDTDVLFSILDDESGVSPSSISATVGGMRYSLASGTAVFETVETAGGFAVRVIPQESFSTGDVIPVVLDARDVAGNRMPTVAYTFTVGSEQAAPTVSYDSPVCPGAAGCGDSASNRCVGVRWQGPVVASISDTGAGVDFSNLVVQFGLQGNASPVSPEDYRLAGDARAVRMTYEPALSSGLRYETTIIAQDLSEPANVMAAAATLFFETVDPSSADVDGGGDGLPDSYEQCYFGDLVEDRDGDFDGDGATNGQEYDDGTDPTDANDAISVAADSFEDDDVAVDARIIEPSAALQSHNFDMAEDSDWVKFLAQAGFVYRIATDELQARADTQIWLHRGDAAEPREEIAYNNDADASGASEIIFVADSTGPTWYYVQVSSTDSEVYGAFTWYSLGVFADAVAPSITSMVPADGEVTTAVQPTFAADIVDESSGIDASTIAATVDDVPCAATYIPATAHAGSLGCAISDELAPGLHVFAVAVDDLAGNRATRATVFSVSSFALNPSSVSLLQNADAVSFVANGGAKVDAQGQPRDITWAGTGGTVLVNGSDSSLADYTPGTVPGEYTLVATDANGRQARASIEVRASLRIRPALSNVGPGESVTLFAELDGAAATFDWDLDGDAVTDFTGDSVVYQAGLTAGTFEASVTASTAETATAIINVLTTNVGQAVILAATGVDDPAEAFSIRRNAEQAYRAMIQRGFNRDRIHFFTGDPGAEFDGDENGELDDIDGALDKAAVFSLFGETLPPLLSQTSPLVIYVVGGDSAPGVINLGGTENLPYEQLEGLIEILEEEAGIRHLVLLADTDQAGRLPELLSGARRIVMSTTSVDEDAEHAIEGQRSFSFAFFNRVFVGESVGEAFTIARATLQVFGALQSAHIDDDGDGVADTKDDGPLAQTTYIGEPGLGSDGAPQIGSHTENMPLESTTSLALFAQVFSAELLAEVSVTIRAPQDSGLEAVTLAMSEDVTSGQWKLTYDDFIHSGVYRVIFSARDIRGRVSAPVESQIVTEGPYVVDLYPAPGSAGIPQNSKIFFTLVDGNRPLALDTITLDIASVSFSGVITHQAGDCAGQGSDSSRQYLACDVTGQLPVVQPLGGAGWQLLESVQVTIRAENSAGFAMAPRTYAFMVTDSLDGDGDFLPDDFQALLEPFRGPAQDRDGDGSDNLQEFIGGENPVEVFPPDDYEADNAAVDATPTSFEVAQAHNFHVAGDEDWISFTCELGTTYDVWTSALAGRADTILEVYRSDASTLMFENDDFGLTSPESRLIFRCPVQETIFARVRQFEPAVFGPETEYLLEVVESDAPIGTVYGLVVDARTGEPIEGARVELNIGFDTQQVTSHFDGAYIINTQPESNLALTATAQGYVSLYVDGIDVGSRGFVNVPIALQPDVSQDADQDGMPDDWEIANGLNPNDAADALQDPDGDGRNNRDEYLAASDPQISSMPSAPTPRVPIDDAVAVAPVTLTTFNATDPDSAVLTYFFTVTEDDGSTVVEQSGSVNEGVAETSWTITQSLSAGQFYRWSVYADDGSLVGPSADARFQFAAGGQPPPVPTLFAPADTSTVSTLTPTLEVGTAIDPDGDATRYQFEVYDATDLMTPMMVSPVVDEMLGRTHWMVSADLVDSTTYHWRARAEDVGGLSSAWSALWSFDTDTSNILPPPPVLLTPATDGQSLADNPPTFVISGYAQDSDGESVTYDFVLDVAASFDSALVQHSQGHTVDAEGFAQWTPDSALDSQQIYWIRVVGTDGRGYGPAVERSFSVADSALLAAPLLVSPKDLESVAAVSPELVAERVVDPNQQSVTYEFEIYGDTVLTRLIADASGLSDDGSTVRWTVSTALSRGSVYFWRVRAVNASGTQGAWSEVGVFFVEPVESGCHCDGLGAGASWLILAFMPVVLRRRRRRR